MTSEKHQWCLLTAGLACLMVASTVAFSILYEVLSTLEQVTTSTSTLNYIIGTATDYKSLYVDFFLLVTVFIKVVNGDNILISKILRFLN